MTEEELLEEGRSMASITPALASGLVLNCDPRACESARPGQSSQTISTLHSGSARLSSA